MDDTPGVVAAGRTRRGFFVGVNLPWLTYGCDFGASAWRPQGGAGEPGEAARLDEVFARLSSNGLAVVRWFVFCDGRSGIRFDSAGAPSGLDPLVFRDFDAALAAATRHRLSLVPVLFDFLWCSRARLVNGVQLGGRRTAFARAARRRLLFERVVGPFARRFGEEPAIECWDVFNEPEWATLGYGSFNPIAAVWPRTMRSLLGGLVASVREVARQPITVGLASGRGLPLVREASLDVYQLHWYDRCAPFVEDVAARLDKPVLLGEFPTEGSARDGAEILRGAQGLGYCGALGWSAMALDGHSSLVALERAAEAMRSDGGGGERASRA